MGNRVINENPFNYTTVDKPCSIIGREEQIIKVISCLESMLSGNSCVLFIVGPENSGKTSFLNLIKRIGESCELDVVNLFTKTLEYDHMEFNYKSYFIDCIMCNEVEKVLEKISIDNYELKNAIVKLNIKNVEIEGNFEKKDSSKDIKYIKRLKKSAIKFKEATVYLLDDAFNLLKNEDSIKIMNSIITELRVNTKKNFAFIFSCTTVEYEELKHKIRNDYIKINIYEKSKIKKHINKCFEGLSLDISDIAIDQVIELFNCDMFYIIELFKNIVYKTKIARNIDELIPEAYSEMIIEHSSKYNDILKGFDYNHRKIINYITFNEEKVTIDKLKCLLGIKDIDIIKIIILKLESAGLIEISKNYEIKLKSIFVKDCIEQYKELYSMEE
ncbi:MAG: ATP-binding protein [Clostridium celatum]|nr:ATP-binding protein [Clostridium celatum]MDU4979414.1 ATP-binding protein [Clostridium celatum]